MLYSTLVVAASAFAGFASAQTNSTFATPIPCCSLAVSQVNSTERSTWCDANTNTCVDMCGGQANIASNGNNCDAVSGTMSKTASSTNMLADPLCSNNCKCTNGSDVTAAMTNYEQSVPGQMCRKWYGECVVASGQDRAKRYQCELASQATCGNLTTKSNTPAASSSGSASGSASRTSGSPAATSAGASDAAASPSKAAAASLAQYGTPVLAGGLLAIFGMAL